MAKALALSFRNRNEATIGARDRNKIARIAKNLETTIEFLTASPPMGMLLTKPAEVMLFFTGADTAPQGLSKDTIYKWWPNTSHDALAAFLRQMK